MSNFAERWRDITRRVTCQKCKTQDEAHKMVKCSEEDCHQHFHKTCINPLWTEQQWEQHASTLICDDCADVCMICGTEEEDDEHTLIVCDYCEEMWHWECLEEEERCDWEDVGDEEKEWFCPNCAEECAADREWVNEAVVQDDDMQASDCFTRSTCQCNVCREMNEAVDQWDTFEPQNHIQQALKNAIDNNQGLVNQVMDNLHFIHNVPLPKS
jgi:hypothetical protein